MAQGALPFQYSEDRSSTGVTALAGLAAYLDLWQAAGLPQSLRRHLGVTQEQGWTDAQVVTALALLNLAGGECVADMKALEKDGGLGAGAALGRDSRDAPEGAAGDAWEMAQGAPSQRAVGLVGVPVSGPVP